MSLRSKARDFIECLDGAITALGLFLLLTMLGIGGLAIDYANAVHVKTHLQVAADSAAHAAILTREFNSEADAKAQAIRIANGSLPKEKYGTTLKAEDIEFGYWDGATRTFTPSTGARDAVRVSTRRFQSQQNGVVTYFLRFAGVDNIDVISQSIYETYYPTCLREGFVADGRVDVQSNNTYTAGFCIHSNSHVELNNNNVFDKGVIVSMPDTRNLVMPSAGFSKNAGLEQALRSGSYKIRILQRVEDIMAGYGDPTSQYFRSGFVDLPVKVETLSPATTLDASVWVPGHVHRFDCSGGGGGGTSGGGKGKGKGKGKGGGGGGGGSTVKIPSSTTLVNGVIDTDCLIDIGANSVLEDVMIISRNTDIAAISGASGVVLGRDDHCFPGGGTTIVTKGGVNFPAKLRVYGGQIIAERKIDFEANANGIEGVSMISGGEIDGTSNMDMGFCNGAGLEHQFDAQYFRMAR